MSIKDKWENMPLAAKCSIAYAVCSILQKCLSFITLPLFTRLLTTEQFGQVTIYNSWMGILSVFLTLNLAYGSFSTAMAKYEDDRSGYISAIEGICIALSILFFAIYLPFNNMWNILFELPTSIMCIMAVEITCSTALLLWCGKKRFEFEYKTVVIITLVTSIASTLAQFFLVITNDEKGYARIVGAAMINIMVGGTLLIYNIKIGKKIFNKGYWRYALGFNVPLLAYYLSQVVFNQSDRIMISHLVGKEEAAIYGVAYSLAMVLTFVLNAINNSYVPWYYGKIKEKKTEDNRSVSLAISGLLSVLLLGVIWFAPEIIRIMAGPKYEAAIYVVPPVAISLLLLFYSQLFINVEFYYEEKQKLVGASIGAAVLNLVLNWFFIKAIGFIAAAYTTLASYIIFAMCNYFEMKSTLKEKGVLDNSFDYKGLIELLILFIIASYIGVLMYKTFIPRAVISTCVLLAAFYKRKDLKKYYEIIRHNSRT